MILILHWAETGYICIFVAILSSFFCYDMYYNVLGWVYIGQGKFYIGRAFGWRRYNSRMQSVKQPSY